MRKIIGTVMLGASLLAGLTAPSNAQGQGVLKTGGASFDLRSCALGGGVTRCIATPLTLAAGVSYGSVCSFGAGYSTAGAQSGVCAIDNGSGKPGTAMVNVETKGCDKVSIDLNGSYPVTIRLTDAVEDRWTLTALRLNTSAHAHEPAGQDRWVLDPTTSLAQFKNAEGRVLSLALGGTLRSSSNCPGVYAGSFLVDLAGRGPIG